MASAEETSPPPAGWAGLGETAPRPSAPRRRLFRKYALIFIALVGAALLINSGFDFWFSYQENKSALVRVQQEKAESAAQRIAEFVEEIKSQIGWTTHAQWDAGPVDQRKQDYVRLQRQVPAITELQQLDAEGKERLKVSRLAMDVIDSGADFSQSPAFTEAKARRVWFSPVYFRKESEPYMTIAMARDGRNAGVTVAEINLKLLFDVVTALKIGQGGYAYVVDQRGRLIAHPDISLVLRDTDLSKLPQVAGALNPQPGGAGVTAADNVAGRPVLTAHAAIPQLGWRVFVEVPLTEAFAPLYGAALRTLVLLALGLIAATLVALVIARRMTGPIHAIAEGAERIGAGELSRRIDIHTGDELEGLAQQFNRMAADLQKSYAELEQRVADRTAELSEALDQQTATAEVLGVINSSPGDLAPVFDAMLDKAIRLCQAAYGHLLTYDGECFHRVSVRGEQRYVEWPEGPIRPGPIAPLGRISRGERIVHIADIWEEEVYRTVESFREMADMRGSRSQITVALCKEDVLLGAIVVYRQEVRPFTDKQIALLQNFAAQAVIAMENARLITDTREALEQQTATAEVLGVINSSPGDLAPVFDSMLEKAMRLCEASVGNLITFDGECFHLGAGRGPTEFNDWVRQVGPMQPAPGTTMARMREGEEIVHITDIADDDAYRAGNPVRRALVEIGGFRTFLGVALRRDDVLLGALQVYRQEVRPFTEKQIALLQNFAAQAVIAMENARLITETREALEQQTATAEVLGVINSSPGDLAPVFDAMLEKATRLCDAAYGSLATYGADGFRGVAAIGFPMETANALSRIGHPPAGTALGRVERTGQTVQITDISIEPAYDQVYAINPWLRRVRTNVVVPLLKEGVLAGAFIMFREQVRPFSDKEIALLQNFAAQAVIAMENARLITETREALEQQTATAEVLGVINSSPGDLAPVFDAMVDKAIRLCEAACGHLLMYDGQHVTPAAVRGGPEYTDYMRSVGSVSPGIDSPVGRALRGEPVVHIVDAREKKIYQSNEGFREQADMGGFRSMLVVGLRREGTALGTLTVFRQDVRPFTDKHIALLQNFAAQAVIAMENARLITETREALDQQTATAEVLGVINSSPGDLAPVFDAMLDKALSLCGAAFGVLWTYDGNAMSAAASRNAPPAYAEFLASGPHRPGEVTAHGRLIRGSRVEHIPDVAASEDYRRGDPFPRALVDLGGGHTILAVPLRRDDVFLGDIFIYRQEVRPFTDKQIALLQNFAAQAVIAMENARLITETREALEQQTATAEVLGVINSSPGDLAPVFDAILEKAHTLCGATHGALGTYDSDYYFRSVATRGYPDPLVARLREGFDGLINPVTRPLIDGARFAHIPDLAEVDHPIPQAVAKLGGFHTGLFLPLRKDGRLLGHISVTRSEVRPFAEKEIALLENFAAQAVIAMENARLITETREALEQQTATAEVLGVINSSPGDLAPVFDAILEKAHSLCGAAHGHLSIYDGEQFRAAATQGVPEAFAELLRQPFRPGLDVGRRLLAGEALIHIPDMTALTNAPDDRIGRAAVEIAGARTILIIPLRKDGALLGYITAHRTEVRPFTDKQIALLQNFAAQAVIAMENARLITETREALDQQTATAEVLGVINSSPGDLTPVFDAMLEKATDLCDAASGVLWTAEGELFRAVASRGLPLSFEEFLRTPVEAGPDTGIGRLGRGERVAHIADMAAASAYGSGNPLHRAAVDLGGIRSLLAVPLQKDGALLGAFGITRLEVRPFSDKQIALLQNFAAQAVIAMENARLITETREALDQQTATAEVLGVINSSPGDLAPVFDAMLGKALNLCEAAFGFLTTYDGQDFTAAAQRGVPAELAEYFATGMDQPRPGDSHWRLLGGEDIVHNVDQLDDDAYRSGNPLRRAIVDLGGARSALVVALRKDRTLVGAFTIYRKEVRPFSGKQIALLQNFAAQAVIAMENARLLTETRERTRDLQESLEYQTAISDVLKVISQSTFELQPVLESVVATAVRLCRADQATIYRLHDGEYRWAAGHALAPAFERIEREVRIRPGTGTLVGRVAIAQDTVQILDCWADPLYEVKEDAQTGGIRTLVGVPLLRDGAPIGVIGLARQRVEAYTEKEVDLVRTFADQAVIAIENARLLNELRERTADIQESLEYQTATSDVLKVISRSDLELEPVLESLVETATRLCQADHGFVFRRHGDRHHLVASFGLDPEFRDYMIENPFLLDRGTLSGRVALERQIVHIDDAATDPEYSRSDFQERGDLRTGLGVPLLREDTLLGIIILYRSRVERFTDKQIELVTTFADQAVIAIENARLLGELRERTDELARSVEELKALAEVGQAVSSTLDLGAVLSTILNRSVGLTGADAGVIFRYSQGRHAFRLVEAVGWDAGLSGQVRAMRIDENMTLMGEAVTHRSPAQIADLRERPSNALRDATLAAGYRSVLIVPLVGADQIFGALLLQRRRPGEFPEATLRLMQTLAAQSVLAIQNARLFREIAEKSEQLALASQHKSQFLANMSHELRTPLNAILGYAELLVDGIYGEVPQKAMAVLERVQNNGKHLLALINDVLDLSKIEAGQLVLTFEDYALPDVVQSVVTATEALASTKGLKMSATVQPGLPTGHGDARRLSQVLLNLVGNALKFTDQGEVAIGAAAEDGHFVLTVRDTGPGIAPEDQHKIFGEFQQVDNSNTRKKGGTGLGLAISKRMVEMQGGSIDVESELGRGATFRVTLPIRVEHAADELAGELTGEMMGAA